MSFSLIEKPKLHLDRLDHEIEVYKNIFNKEPYIFMNQTTIEELIDMNIRVLNFTKPRYISFLDEKAVYRGCKVYCDVSLDYGEIELR